MEQKDYILREIEKIGVIMRAILQKLFGRKDNLAISIEQQIEAEKGMLLDEVNFDLDKFLLLNGEDANIYITSFKGFNTGNIELMADSLAQMGFNDKSGNSGKYLEKALQLYQLCNMQSKTYSIEREKNIDLIKNALQGSGNA